MSRLLLSVNFLPLLLLVVVQGSRILSFQIIPTMKHVPAIRNLDFFCAAPKERSYAGRTSVAPWLRSTLQLRKSQII
jgi:hypothetical protein